MSATPDADYPIPADTCEFHRQQFASIISVLRWIDDHGLDSVSIGIDVCPGDDERNLHGSAYYLDETGQCVDADHTRLTEFEETWDEYETHAIAPFAQVYREPSKYDLYS